MEALEILWNGHAVECAYLRIQDGNVGSIFASQRASSVDALIVGNTCVQVKERVGKPEPRLVDVSLNLAEGQKKVGFVVAIIAGAPSEY